MVEFLAQPELIERYNKYLCSLVAHKSTFTDDQGIREALKFCHRIVDSAQPLRKTYFDDGGNLISFSPNFEPERNAVFLSAHIDTVDASAADWRSVSDPFTPVETPTHIIGRGANDCKAGVALMLLSPQIFAQTFDNVVLLFSYREEGNRAKTSTCIGAELGHSIPLSKSENVLLCLENTVKIDKDKYFIDIYDAEPCNIFISVIDNIPTIQSFLHQNPDWKPVFIRPESGMTSPTPSRSYNGTSGHAATVANIDNMIYRAIMEGGDVALSGGDRVQTSVIHNHVNIYDFQIPGAHEFILNYRGMTSIDVLHSTICSLKYKEYHPFAYAAGSDRRASLERSFVKKRIRAMPREPIAARFMSNPGRSDASAIWNAAPHRERLDILTVGPGSRSHCDAGIERKTHGPDEGFHKRSGHIATQYIFNLIEQSLYGRYA